MKSKNAFTMIELIFVIIILGILSAVALPKFQGVREQADIAKGKADLATIRTAIVNERQRRVMTGDANFITAANLHTGGLFGGVLGTPMTDAQTSGNWHNVDNDTIIYYAGDRNASFEYNATNGTLNCNTPTDANTTCGKLSN